MEEVYKEQQQVESGDNGAQTTADSFKSIEDEFPELPTLIYDGPFSDSKSTGEAKLLEGMQQIDKAAARSVAADFLSVSGNNVSVDGECSGDIPCWCCSAEKNGGTYSVSVTKQGGVVLSALCSRQPGEAHYSADKGLSIAKDFLNSCGLSNMKESYHIVQGGILTVNYEYTQDGVICYPDLVKIGIALDDGSLMSYDAEGYIDCHGDEINFFSGRFVSATNLIDQILQLRFIGAAFFLLFQKNLGTHAGPANYAGFQLFHCTFLQTKYIISMNCTEPVRYVDKM